MSMDIGLRLAQLEDGICVGNGQLNSRCKSGNQSEPAEDTLLHTKTGEKEDLGFQQPEYRPVRSAETEGDCSNQEHRSDAGEDDKGHSKSPSSVYSEEHLRCPQC